MTDPQRIEQLLRGVHRCISIVTYEEDYALGLIREAALAAGRPLLVWCNCHGLRDGLLANEPGPAESEKPLNALERLTRAAPDTVIVTLDLQAQLRDERVFRGLRNLLSLLPKMGAHLLMLDYRDELAPVLAAHSLSVDLSLPDEVELERLTIETLRRLNQERTIDVQITRRQLSTIVQNMRGLSRRQAADIIAETVADDARFDVEDLKTVVALKRAAVQRGGLLEFVDTPVSIDEIGGLKRLKNWLALRQNTFGPEARDFGLTAPRGILLLGVQGAGKSMCAKAIAAAWARPLLRMDVGALYDRYVGESERRLRDAFQQAETMSPVILWVDEVEKAFASAASRNTDGGLSQRMFGMLLTWMQEHSAPVFLVATANDIEALPPELLRKGRFDEIFFVDLPSLATRRDIFEIHLRKRKRNPAEVDLDKLAAGAEGFSGAEIEQAIIAALHNAFGTRTAFTTDSILQVLRESPPLSVTMRERVIALRHWASGRCVPAD